jgi:hypothetical protein
MNLGISVQAGGACRRSRHRPNDTSAPIGLVIGPCPNIAIQVTAARVGRSDLFQTFRRTPSAAPLFRR